MSIKTILVCLTNEVTADSLLKAACVLARRFDAHVTAIHTLEALQVYPGVAVHIPASVFETFNRAQADRAKQIEATFEAHIKDAPFVAEWRLFKAQSTKASERILDSARLADLIVVPNDDPELERGDQYHLQEELIRDSGRPVLVIPRDFDAKTIGTHALVGWNDTSEAARAAHDALALVVDGAQAHLLRVHGDDDELTDDDTLSELAKTYARHGIETSIGHRAYVRRQVAQIIEQEAIARGCDLIVAGAFSHSLPYELIHGATTRELLRHATRPVLFSR